MQDFPARMHQIQFRLAQIYWEAFNAPQTPYLVTGRADCSTPQEPPPLTPVPLPILKFGLIKGLEWNKFAPELYCHSQENHFKHPSPRQHVGISAIIEALYKIFLLWLSCHRL